MQSLDPSYSTQANGLERRVSPLTALQLPQNLRCCSGCLYIYIGLSRLFRGSSWRFFTFLVAAPCRHKALDLDKLQKRLQATAGLFEGTLGLR